MFKLLSIFQIIFVCFPKIDLDSTPLWNQVNLIKIRLKSLSVLYRLHSRMPEIPLGTAFAW